jgi:hypothetical protein
MGVVAREGEAALECACDDDVAGLVWSLVCTCDDDAVAGLG